MMKHNKVILDPIKRTALALEVAQKGLPHLAESVGLHIQTIARGLAGLPIHRGSALLIERALSGDDK